ncbi:outer membrane protein assembly factor BamB family protein [Paractinoplanes lichenicola]|uniref:PQQ-binding-like beta-propeller repeat protein n=1 Tax=Paractinoplanes lichenicola TaxID=2802976 RepID=A0ABS1W589_9ACTN|nr:PQQ-binding-like beta-propeller repeat protein [Actinoplanes lichenicola]MBL7261901.1 PQQ-binding-like beta-propeller repeat protein [Actinoplanes lichenicola]
MIVWTRPLHVRSEAVAVSPDALIVAERLTRLVRLDPRTGDQLWEQRVEDCWGTVVRAGDRCLYLSQTGILRCFDLGTGDPLWSVGGLRERRYVTVSGSAVFVGGWRGYHPLERLSLVDGSSLPLPSPVSGRLSWPVSIPGHQAVLVAASEKSALYVVSGTGIRQFEHPLEDFRLSHTGDGGRITFVAGSRTVMDFTLESGVRLLWRNDRDLAPAHRPMLDGDTLWLVDDAGLAVVGLAGRTVARLRPGRFRAVTLLAGRPLAVVKGRPGVVWADRPGDYRVCPRQVDRFFPGHGELMHAVGKGHLVALDRSGIEKRVGGGRF